MAEDLGVRLLRIYVADDDRDSRCRILVDRLWPRGVSKADADLHEWLKDVAPSSDLRKWYGHDVGRFDEFARRYRGELQAGPASAGLQHLVALARTTPVTLVTATRDVEHSGARVLCDTLMDLLSTGRARVVPPR